MKHWERTCQECGRKQFTKPVPEYKGDSWQDAKCVECKSEALDYGKWVEGESKCS